uniref:Uncharacterized protein n=1 Tax=Anguilla anguilla TaxID=7936 RepID=A0A0E9WR39_ANGAN
MVGKWVRDRSPWTEAMHCVHHQRVLWVTFTRSCCKCLSGKLKNVSQTYLHVYLWSKHIIQLQCNGSSDL